MTDNNSGIEQVLTCSVPCSENRFSPLTVEDIGAEQVITCSGEPLVADMLEKMDSEENIGISITAQKRIRPQSDIVEDDSAEGFVPVQRRAKRVAKDFIDN